MGVVYRARDTRLERDVALKFLPPSMSHEKEAKERFYQEARAASGLDHPNICTIHEIGETEDGRLYIAMAYYDGQTLKYLRDQAPREEGEVASIGLQIADGLAKAHNAGIVHRDIKPANVMLTGEGRIKVLDFGVAKLGEGLDLTQQGSTVGTTAYMSPEQARGETVDGRTDLWSLGVVLYELASGRRPFEGTYEQAIVYSILNQPIEPLEGELGAVINRLLEKAPEQRFASAEEVVETLRPLATGVHASHGTSGTALDSTPPAQRRWVIPAAAVALAALLWFFFERGGPGSADEPTDPHRIVILPFIIQGTPDMEPLGEGMVTLLSTMLDGADQITTVDQAAVLEHLRQEDDPVVGPGLGAELSGVFSAGRFVVGSIVRAGTENRINAGLYLADGTRESEANATYSGDADFISAVDRLAAELVGGLLGEPSEELGSLAIGTTDSFGALKNYLEAENLLRAGEFDAAMEKVDEALETDSTFALAWYLKSEILGWQGDPRAVLAPVRKAAEYSSGLSGRVARFIEAEVAFQEGRAVDAERMLRSILRDYPESIEATGSLGEVLEHYHIRESSKMEALRLFERVTRLAPGNQQYAMHHADLLAYRGNLHADYHGLDSLAALYAGLPEPEPGDSLDWSAALERMSPDGRRYMIMYSRLRGSAEDSLASFDITPNRIFDGGRFGGSGHMLEAATTLPDAFKQSEENGWFVNRMIGKSESAQSDLPDTATPGFVPMAALLASIPTHEVSLDSLQSLGRLVAGADPEELSDRYGIFAKEYLLGVLAWRTQQPESLGQHRDAFTALQPDTSIFPVVESLGLELDALVMWQSGQLESAEEAMRAAIPDGAFFLDRDEFERRRNPTWFLAEILQAKGDLDGALDYFKTSDFLTAVPGWERAAAIHEQRGELDEAIRYYDLITRVWREADGPAAERVEAARQRMEALLERRTRENGS